MSFLLPFFGVAFFLLGISRFLKDFGKNNGPGFQRPDFRGQEWANPCQNPFK